MTTLQPFHETLGAAVSAAFDYLEARRAAFDPALRLDNPFTFGGVAYGTSKDAHFELVSFKGKPTRKFGHINVWRSETGRYEVNAYVL
jgi:hypothetical protein